MKKIITPEIEEKLISWCRAEKYSQGDDYDVWITKDNKFAVGYSNDYPMQHGNGKHFILSDSEFEYAMNRPLTELELMQKFWWPKTMQERQDLCDKYFKGKVARCLWDDELIDIYRSENNINTTMDKETARKKYPKGNLQIEFNDTSKLELLNYITDLNFGGAYKFYRLNGCSDKPFTDAPIVKISEISDYDRGDIIHPEGNGISTKEEKKVIWEESELQWRWKGNERWKDCDDNRVEYRLKPTELKEKQAVEWSVKETSKAEKEAILKFNICSKEDKENLLDMESIEVDDIEVEDLRDYEYWNICEWENFTDKIMIRKKPKPDFSKEIDALNEKAKEAGNESSN